MLAEGVHSVADAGNQLLLLLGGRKAQKAGRRRAPVRLRPRALRLRLRRLDHPVLGRRRVLALRGHRASCSDPHPLEVAVAADRSCCSSRSCSSRSRCAPPSRSRTTCAASRAGCSSCAARRRPSCPSCCSRTSPRSSAWCSRFIGVGLTVITGNGVFDAIGTLFDRHPAHRRRDRARHRDEEPAGRRGRDPGRRRRRSRTRSSPGPRSSASST